MEKKDKKEFGEIILDRIAFIAFVCLSVSLVSIIWFDYDFFRKMSWSSVVVIIMTVIFYRFTYYEKEK